jgi:hypothetical protein
VRDGDLETAKKRTKERVPFRRDSVNESLSREERMEVARKALQEDACSPDIGRLEEAVRTLLGCGLPSFMKKGVQFRHARFRLMLARCAETGRACPDRAHKDSVFARGRAAGHASGTENPSSVKGSSLPPAKDDVSRTAAGSVHGTPESSPLSKGGLQARPASGFKGAVKVTPKRGAKVDRTGHADSGVSGTSGEDREIKAGGGQETPSHNADGDLLGELMRCFQANDHAPSPGVSSKPLPVASFTPLNVVPSDAPQGQNEAGVLRLWDVAELGGMLLDSFDPP